MSHVFISYSTRDASYANRLADRLRAEGFNVWIDNTRLRSSEDWWRAIVLAIDACAAFVVLLTPHSDQSKWVQREITLADQRDKPIFPLLVAGDIDTPNWALFVRTQYEDVRSGDLPTPAFYDKLAQHSARQPGKGRDITDPRLPRPQQLPDPTLQAAIDNPPVPETKPRRKLASPLLAVLMVIVAGIAAAILFIGWPPPPDRQDLSPDQHFLQGIQAADRGDDAGAIDHFTRAIDSGFAPLAEALTARGDVYRFQGDAVRALRDYDAALAEDPGFFNAHLGRGYIFSDEGNHNLAIENFARAVEHAPNDEARAWALANMGWSFYHMGAYDPAVEHFSAALETGRQPEAKDVIHYGLGLALLRLDNLPGAIRNLEQATIISPDFPEPYRELSEAQERAGSPQAALESLRRYAELQGPDVEEWVLRRIEQLESVVRGE